MFLQGLPEEEEDQTAYSFCGIPQNLPILTKPIEAKALRYVSGYIAKKIGRLPNCECKSYYFKSEEVKCTGDEMFIKFKEYDRFQRLKYVNSVFNDKLKEALTIIKYIFNKHLYKPGIINFTLNKLKERIFFTNCEHDEIIKTTIFKYFIKINLFNYCKQVNHIFRGLDLRNVPKNAPKLFICAKNLYNSTSKRKKCQDKNRYAMKV